MLLGNIDQDYIFKLLSYKPLIFSCNLFTLAYKSYNQETFDYLKKLFFQLSKENQLELITNQDLMNFSLLDYAITYDDKSFTEELLSLLSVEYIKCSFLLACKLNQITLIDIFLGCIRKYNSQDQLQVIIHPIPSLSPIHFAVINKNIPLINILLSIQSLEDTPNIIALVCSTNYDEINKIFFTALEKLPQAKIKTIINTPYFNGFTALHAAAKCNNKETTTKLLKYGANFLAETDPLQTSLIINNQYIEYNIKKIPLYIAIEYKNLEVSLLLIDHATIDYLYSADKSFYTAIILAVQLHFNDLVHPLLETYIQKAYFNTILLPLYNAAIKFNNNYIEDFLIKNALSLIISYINTTNINEALSIIDTYTSINNFSSSFVSHDENEANKIANDVFNIMKFLINANRLEAALSIFVLYIKNANIYGNINQYIDEHFTILHHAAIVGHLPLVKVLTNNGADIKMNSKFNYNAIGHACLSNNIASNKPDIFINTDSVITFLGYCHLLQGDNILDQSIKGIEGKPIINYINDQKMRDALYKLKKYVYDSELYKTNIDHCNNLAEVLFNYLKLKTDTKTQKIDYIKTKFNQYSESKQECFSFINEGIQNTTKLLNNQYFQNKLKKITIQTDIGY